MPHRLWEVTGGSYDELDKRVMVLPVGSIERHGLHLPLGTDGILALHIAERVADTLGAVLLPPIWYGVCTAMRGHPGTFDISPRVLADYVREVLLEAGRNGAKLVIVINGHGGNTTALHMAALEASRESDLAVAVVDWWRDVAQEKRRSLFQGPGHGGEDETSAMLAVDESLADMDEAEAVIVSRPPMRVYSRRLEEEIYYKAMTGDAKSADKERGREWLDAVVEDIATKARWILIHLEGRD